MKNIERKSKIKFDLGCVPYWASEFKFKDETPVNQLVGPVQKRGYFEKSELQTVCEWKSLRPAWHLEENEESLVQEVTRFALKTEYDKAAIESLTILHGVRGGNCVRHPSFLSQTGLSDFRLSSTLVGFSD